MQQFVNLSWRDPRIQYHNLHADSTRNSLLEAEKADIWIPAVTFLNTGAQEQSCQRTFREVSQCPEKATCRINHLKLREGFVDSSTQELSKRDNMSLVTVTREGGYQVSCDWSGFVIAGL